MSVYMSRADEIMLFVVYLAILGILYGIARNSARRQKGLLFGVTVPETALELPQVQVIIRRFKWETDLLALAMVVVYIPLFFLRTMWLLASIWIVLFYAAITVPYLPYLKAHKQMKQLKKEQGWAVTPPLRLRVVDTNTSETSLPEPIGLWTLIPPLAISLAPVFLPGQTAALRGVVLSDALVIVVCWAAGRWTFRRKGEMVTADTALNQTLQRVRRAYWDRFWRFMLWGCTGLNFLMGTVQNGGIAVMGSLAFLILLMGGTLWMELRLRRTQERLTKGAAALADEDDVWLLGSLYYNPADTRVMVAKRLGLGTTVNLATPVGKWTMAVLVVIIVGSLFVGPAMGVADSIPTELELRGSAPAVLVASHGKREKYTLSADRISDVQLRDSLPACSRTVGTGLDHYLEGDFYVTGEGQAYFCLDPTAAVFLRVEANGIVYWFTGDSAEETQAVANALEKGSAQ